MGRTIDRPGSGTARRLVNAKICRWLLLALVRPFWVAHNSGAWNCGLSQITACPRSYTTYHMCSIHATGAAHALQKGISSWMVRFIYPPTLQSSTLVVHVWVFTPGSVPRRSIAEGPSQPSRASPGGAPPNASAPAGVGSDLWVQGPMWALWTHALRSLCPGDPWAR